MRIGAVAARRHRRLPCGAATRALNAAFDKIFVQTMKDSPGFATSLGRRQGRPRAASTRPSIPKPYDVSRQEGVAHTREALALLQQIAPATLSPSAALNREIVIYGLERNLVAYPRIRAQQRPEPLRHQPAGRELLLDSRLPQQHPSGRECGRRRGLSLAPVRVRQAARLRDRRPARQAARGYLAPGWSLDLALGQIAKLRGQPRGEQRPRHLARRPGQGQGHRRRLGRRARPRSSRAKSIRRSTARSRC